jgi:hypothetical protein
LRRPTITPQRHTVARYGDITVIMSIVADHPRHKPANSQGTLHFVIAENGTGLIGAIRAPDNTQVPLWASVDHAPPARRVAKQATLGAHPAAVFAFCVDPPIT